MAQRSPASNSVFTWALQCKSLICTRCSTVLNNVLQCYLQCGPSSSMCSTACELGGQYHMFQCCLEIVTPISKMCSTAVCNVINCSLQSDATPPTAAQQISGIICSPQSCRCVLYKYSVSRQENYTHAREIPLISLLEYFDYCWAH